MLAVKSTRFPCGSVDISVIDIWITRLATWEGDVFAETTGPLECFFLKAIKLKSSHKARIFTELSHIHNRINLIWLGGSQNLRTLPNCESIFIVLVHVFMSVNYLKLHNSDQRWHLINHLKEELTVYLCQRSPRCSVYGNENLIFSLQDVLISASLDISSKTEC